MYKNYYYWNSMKIRKAAPWEPYQDVCDDVFGEDALKGVVKKGATPGNYEDFEWDNY